MKIPMKDLSNNVILCTWIFFGIVAYSTPNSKEYQGDYIPVANNETMQIRTESNNEWGSISDPKY